MVFSSLIFTFLFLPAVILCYGIAPRFLKNYILLAASILFYAYGEPRFVFIMLGSVIINYLTGLGIGYTRNRILKRVLMILSVIIDIGILFVYKYLNFFTGREIIHSGLPIGISFYTFQILSYVIDVYTGRVKAQKNLFTLALYISFFPQLIAGPIVRYTDIEKQIMTDRKVTIDDFGDGALRYTQGFLKKVLIANNVSLIAEKVFTGTDMGSAALWVGALAYAVQIYFDFSGYSDMAIGLGRMFGFRFRENFNLPYTASSITDFWRRWHISLSSWFRDYVYIPLGGSRVSAPRHILNLFIVWSLTGLWHGANYTFIAWGFSYFVLLTLEKYLIRPEKRGAVFGVFYRIFTLVCVLLLWVVFNSPSLGFAGNYITGMFGIGRAWQFAEALSLVRGKMLYLVCGLLLSTGLPQDIFAKLQRLRISRYLEPFVITASAAVLMIWAVSFLAVGTHNPFIYFNF
ncbi:MAG: MBOAT family protein [Solobacterium sp.]|nr:MBOAT family protein [Solobacterium sp.]